MKLTRNQKRNGWKEKEENRRKQKIVKIEQEERIFIFLEFLVFLVHLVFLLFNSKMFLNLSNISIIKMTKFSILVKSSMKSSKRKNKKHFFLRSIPIKKCVIHLDDENRFQAFSSQLSNW